MASKGVSSLKFVGTVSLGLLTGLSYTLSTLTVPTLLALPSADSAIHAFDYLAAAAKKHLRTLSSISGSAFLLAFLFSPRSYRHPYLLYTSALVLGSRLVTSDLVAPYLYLDAPAAATRTTTRRTPPQQRKETAPRTARMEASYEVLGSGSDAHSEGTSGGEDYEAEDAQSVNGEEVRSRVQGFLKGQTVQAVINGLGFAMAVVGIWGDGAVQVVENDVFVIGV
ncbi:hypothetical protein VTK73DRAFT_8105 [Phialemonium thermophilum]|uniref:Autophagy-related protein 33 n=1 Tax=Phialemonium thermophilum TaxID=223376 RepID=A0ABR3WAF1_9PEZI